MRRKIDPDEIVGSTFERLRVIERVGKDRHGYKYLCECECGNHIVLYGGDLRHKRNKSCGCLRKEVTATRNKERAKHNMHNTNLYHCWNAMKQRCSNTHHHNYKNYGGRGIGVCKEWQDFLPFCQWAMANGYEDNLTIDRIDVNKNYEPSNCRWATQKEQANNRRPNHPLTHNGETHTISEWAEILDINVNTLYRRINVAKWSSEKALTAEVKHYERN